MPIDDGKEILLFDIFRHNSSEGDLLIDQFEIQFELFQAQLND